MTGNSKKHSVAFVTVLLVLAAGCTAVGFTTDIGAETNAQMQQNGTTETPTTTSTETPQPTTEQAEEDADSTAVEPLDRPNATRIQENASLIFNDQSTDGSSVTVSQVTFENGSFETAAIWIYNEEGTVIAIEGVPETAENVHINFNDSVDLRPTDRINENMTLTARLIGLNGRQFVNEDGSVVADTANITIVDDGDEGDELTPDQPTAEEGITYYQVDFVATDPIKDLRGPEGTYADDQLVRFVHGSTEKPVMRRAPGVLAYAENNELAERIESQEITIENGTATITFTVAEGSAPVELSLVSYTKPGPGWSPQTETKQEFVDADTGTFGSGTYTLTVSLPGEEVTDNGTATASGKGQLSVVGLSADADGDDNNNLNDEYIVYENTGDAPLDLTGWTVTDSDGNTFTFPDGFTLAPGEQVTLYTGSGTNTDSALYWGQASEVWNNGADMMTVRNADGEIVLQRSYP